MSEDVLEIPAPHETRELFGHATAESRLLDLYRSGRQHHALLLAGPSGIGKATLAFRLAGFLLSHPDEMSAEVARANDLTIDGTSRTARLVARLAHPDLTVIKHDMFPEENRSGEIKVDHVRWALSRLSTMADADGWRVCIIDSADDLNRNAANALLKALEEPPPRTVMILVSHHPRRLLATIRSRCMTVELSPPSLDEAVRAVVAAQPDLSEHADLNGLVALADGAPGQALHLARLGGLELHQKLKSMIDSLPALDVGEVHVLAGELAGARAEERFGLFMDMLQVELSRMAGDIAHDQRSTRALEPWIELWDKVARAYDDTMAFNLDRKQLILSACFGLEAAARKAAPH